MVHTAMSLWQGRVGSGKRLRTGMLLPEAGLRCRSFITRVSGKIKLTRKWQSYEAQWALNSAVECHLHTVEVIGSNPIAPTTHQNPMAVRRVVEFCGWKFTSFCLLQGAFV